MSSLVSTRMTVESGHLWVGRDWHLARSVSIKQSAQRASRPSSSGEGAAGGVETQWTRLHRHQRQPPTAGADPSPACAQAAAARRADLDDVGGRLVTMRNVILSYNSTRASRATCRGAAAQLLGASCLLARLSSLRLSAPSPAAWRPPAALGRTPSRLPRQPRHRSHRHRRLSSRRRAAGPGVPPGQSWR